MEAGTGVEMNITAPFPPPPCSSRTAFCCWLLANILFCMPVVLYAGYMTLATAAFIFCSAASFSITMNVPRCVFSVGNGSFEAHYSHSFWLALATGGDEQQTQQTELHEMMHKT